MELVAILAILARRWPWVVAGLLAAVVVAIAAEPPPQRHAIAESQVVVDTPSSRTVDLSRKTEAIATQTELLAAEILNDRERAAIAGTASISPTALDVIIASDALPPQSSPLGTALLEVSQTPVLPNTVEVRIKQEVPIMTISATAASIATAARLAQATSTRLQAIAVQRAPSASRGLVVQPLGSVRAEFVEKPAGGPVVVVAIAIGLFALWCAAVVLVPPALRLLLARPAPAAAAAD